MKQIALILLAMAVALGIAAGSVFGLRDARVLAPVPENELEDFLDLFAVRRHEPALQHVSSGARDSIPVDSLALWHRRIANRVGGFKLESTKREWMTDSRASASAVLKGESERTVNVTFPLERENGLWRVADLRPLADAAP